MKRTPETILRKSEEMPCPKSIRHKTLIKLVAVNYAMTNSCLKTGISIDNLTEKPKECVDYIMKLIKVNRRTAYDYYTSLLYIHNHHLALYYYTIEKMSNSKGK